MDFIYRLGGMKRPFFGTIFLYLYYIRNFLFTPILDKAKIIIIMWKFLYKRKKFIFRVVRCDNCSQSSTGGYKVQVNLELDSLHIKWLDNVHKKCNHASVDKTLRIILDFYIGVVLKDNKMEKYFWWAKWILSSNWVSATLSNPHLIYFNGKRGLR